MDSKSDFKIRKYRDHYVLFNRKSKSGGHTHIHTRSTCHVLVRLVCKKIIPESDYLKESAMRISRDEKYIADIQDIMEN